LDRWQRKRGNTHSRWDSWPASAARTPILTCSLPHHIKSANSRVLMRFGYLLPPHLILITRSHSLHKPFTSNCHSGRKGLNSLSQRLSRTDFTFPFDRLPSHFHLKPTSTPLPFSKRWPHFPKPNRLFVLFYQEKSPEILLKFVPFMPDIQITLGPISSSPDHSPSTSDFLTVQIVAFVSGRRLSLLNMATRCFPSRVNRTEPD